MADEIVYVVKSNPANTNESSTPVKAFFHRSEADKHIGKGSRYKLSKEVHDTDEVMKKIIRGLDPVQRLVLMRELDRAKPKKRASSIEQMRRHFCDH